VNHLTFRYGNVPGLGTGERPQTWLVYLDTASGDVRLSDPRHSSRRSHKLCVYHPQALLTGLDFTLISVINEKRLYLDGTLVDPTGQWTGRAPAVFYSASIIWGAVAPARFFVGRYIWLYAGFGLGAIVPLGCYWAHKRWPGYKLHKVVFPIICHGGSQVPQ
jgi:hypothetical protein